MSSKCPSKGPCRVISRQKRCTRCKQLLQVGAFAKSSMGSMGVSSICKSCRIADRSDAEGAMARKQQVEHSRIRKIEALLSKKQAKSTTIVEDKAILRLQELCVDVLDVRKWHDGTRSDVGIRAVSSLEDAWIPIQIKSCSSTTPKFVWNLGKKAYNFTTILMTGDVEVSFVLSAHDQQQHQNKIQCNQGVLYFGSTGYWHDVLKPLTSKELIVTLALLLQSGEARKTEYELQMDCSIDSQKEWFNCFVARRIGANEMSVLPSFQSTIDRIENGVRIQDKSAHWLARENTPYFKAKCAKLLNGTEIPYNTGDADCFCFSIIVRRKRLLLQWRIPESCMLELGKLSVVEDGQVVSVGRTAINLPVLGPFNENIALHNDLFGKMPRRDTDLRVALYLRIFEIPRSIDLPIEVCECGLGEGVDVNARV